jgi:exodeoxyribonuclease VII large subunit
MFRRAAALLDFAPRDGQQVELRGRVAVYEPRGELQFVVEAMRTLGAGSLYEQFLALKAKLEGEGLFDAARKRALPRFPRRIGVVSSLGAAALHDVMIALARRAPQVEVIVYPSLVQGSEAPAALVAALQLAGRRHEVDTLILARGGGSLEDLWAFNDERVVRAVASSPIPLVCGVGHETDITLADFAADLRAPTPTAAAEMAAPAAVDLLAGLRTLANRLSRGVERVLAAKAQRLDRLAPRLAPPAARVAAQSRRLDQLAMRLAAAAVQSRHARGNVLRSQATRLLQAAHGRLTEHQHRLQMLAARLRALDPQRVVERGFSVVQTAAGDVVRDPRGLAIGQTLRLRMARGSAEVVLASVRIEP